MRGRYGDMKTNEVRPGPARLESRGEAEVREVTLEAGVCNQPGKTLKRGRTQVGKEAARTFPAARAPLGNDRLCIGQIGGWQERPAGRMCGRPGCKAMA